MLNRHLKGTVARVGIHSFGSNDKYLFSLEKKLLGWQRPDWTLVKPLKNRLSFIYSFHTCNNASWLFVPLTPCLPLWRNPQLLAPSFRDTPNSSLPFIYPMYLQHVSLTTLCPPTTTFFGHWVQLVMLIGTLTHLITAVTLWVQWPCHVLKTAFHHSALPYSLCLSRVFSEPWGMWELDICWRVSTCLKRHLFSVLWSAPSLSFSYDCCREKPRLRAAPSVGRGIDTYKAVWLYDYLAEQQYYIPLRACDLLGKARFKVSGLNSFLWSRPQIQAETSWLP